MGFVKIQKIVDSFEFNDMSLTVKNSIVFSNDYAMFLLDFEHISVYTEFLSTVIHADVDHTIEYINPPLIDAL